MANVILRVKREDGSWAEIPALVGPEGPQGVSIDDIVLKSQEGGVSTYLILLSDGSEKTFQVTDGAIITDVSLINTNVLIDTYRISISDGSYFDFRVTNGRGIKSIAKTSTDVLSDTYTISYNDNTSSTFKVTNGRSITKIVKTQTDVLTDTYTISYNDNTTSTYTITNGRGIDYIEKDETIGISDRYTIHYNDGSTSYYHVVNGEAGPAGSIGNRIYLSGLVDKVNDEEGYGRVKELKESKFDLSKFTVVGSPLISENGVASGFSNTNGLKFNINIPIDMHSIEISDKVIYDDNSSIVQQVYNANNSCRAEIFTDRTRMTFFHGFGISGAINVRFAKAIQTGDILEYYYKADYVSKTATVSVKINSEEPIVVNGTIPSLPTTPVTNMSISNSAFPWQGSIDLKQFSITIDGKEVFSGNPTVLDTIKANNYTVTGSPTITDDGIYQQNATSDGILGAEIGKTFTQNVKVGGRYTIKLDTKTEQLMDLINFGPNNILLYDGIVKSEGNWYVEVSNGTSVAKTLIEIPLKDGDIIDTELIIDGTNMTLYAKLNESVTYTATATSLGTGIINRYQLSTSARSWSGKVDLNTIHVYIDGNLVYQPCLKIPYTKAKTGSKIVDAAWKLRVEDCYNQYGAGNYYLFSSATEQFALPMPDIYGLIQTLEEKKVNRAGDTMTGTLSTPAPLFIYDNRVDSGATPSEDTITSILTVDKNFKVTGFAQSERFTNGGQQMVLGTMRNIDGVDKYSAISAGFDANNVPYTYAPHPANKLDNSNKLATTNWVRNHCCTTPATTKSTASLDAPCYVIENYVNGTSWYRTWADTLVEQGTILGFSYSQNTIVSYSWNYLKALTKFMTGTIVANTGWAMSTTVNFETADKFNPTSSVAGYLRNSGGSGSGYLYITITGY